jgi:hypothetical protein
MVADGNGCISINRNVCVLAVCIISADGRVRWKINKKLGNAKNVSLFRAISIELTVLIVGKIGQENGSHPNLSLCIMGRLTTNATNSRTAIL